MSFKKRFIIFLFLCFYSVIVFPQIHLIQGTIPDSAFQKIKKELSAHYNLNKFREIKFQLIYDKKQNPDHFIIYLFDKEKHSLTTARVNTDRYYHWLSIEKNYRPTLDDIENQPGRKMHEAICPDVGIEFVAFAPHDVALEQTITKEVVDAAKIQGLRTKSLLLKDATRENYFNYLVCPDLKGNFYDGSSNPYMIATVDGFITIDEIQTILRDKFQYKVTNIWVAGEAFEDPMATTLIDLVKAQKFIAGVNELTIGPSDRAGACTMKAAIYGKPITYSFEFCYKKYETDLDEWGIGGYGADFFGE